MSPQTMRDARGARALAGPLFTSAEVFGRERERIFRRRWSCAGPANELADPGSYALLTVGGDPVLLLRGDDGGVTAFHNVCRHRGARLLSEPAGKLRRSIQCPYHAWTYDLAGRLTAAPNMTGVEGFDLCDHGLEPLRAEIWEGLVFLNADLDAEPLSAAMSPLGDRVSAWGMPRLSVAHRTIYDLTANWKLIFQNYSECYHCPALHPALNRLTPYRGSSNELEEGPILGGPMQLSRADGSMTSDGARCAAPLPGLPASHLGLVYYYTVFPTLFLSLHPDFVLIHRLEPLAADRTRITCEWLFHPEARQRDDFDPAPAVDFWDMTNRQDWWICEESQRGVASSAYRPGPYSPLESVVAAFDRCYLDAVGELPESALRATSELRNPRLV